MAETALLLAIHYHTIAGGINLEYERSAYFRSPLRNPWQALVWAGNATEPLRPSVLCRFIGGLIAAARNVHMASSVNLPESNHVVEQSPLRS